MQIPVPGAGRRPFAAELVLGRHPVAALVAGAAVPVPELGPPLGRREIVQRFDGGRVRFVRVRVVPAHLGRVDAVLLAPPEKLARVHRGPGEALAELVVLRLARARRDDGLVRGDGGQEAEKDGAQKHDLVDCAARNCDCATSRNPGVFVWIKTHVYHHADHVRAGTGQWRSGPSTGSGRAHVPVDDLVDAIDMATRELDREMPVAHRAQRAWHGLASLHQTNLLVIVHNWGEFFTAGVL